MGGHQQQKQIPHKALPNKPLPMMNNNVMPNRPMPQRRRSKSDIYNNYPNQIMNGNYNHHHAHHHHQNQHSVPIDAVLQNTNGNHVNNAQQIYYFDHSVQVNENYNIPPAQPYNIPQQPL